MLEQSETKEYIQYRFTNKYDYQIMRRPGSTKLAVPGPASLLYQPMRRAGSTSVARPGAANLLSLARFLEYSSRKEEKVEDFVFKLEKVVETKVSYVYPPSIKKCLTKNLTQAKP